jgi:metal-responsive CopG/Arc/MetJ family transcriptional regulator
LSRFGVSMEEEFLSRFDGYMRRKGYKNRSEAIR